jgi:hypothetical protein
MGCDSVTTTGSAEVNPIITYGFTIILIVIGAYLIVDGIIDLVNNKRETETMSKKLSVECVVTGGKLDSEATLAACALELERLETQAALLSDKVAGAVAEVVSDKPCNQAFLVSQVAAKLGVSAADFNALKEAVEDHVRAHSDPEDPDRLFDVRKGKGGGTSRRV